LDPTLHTIVLTRSFIGNHITVGLNRVRKAKKDMHNRLEKEKGK